MLPWNCKTIVRLIATNIPPLNADVVRGYSRPSEDIPFKIIKNNGDIFVNVILQTFNQCIIDRKFYDQLNKTEQTLVMSSKKETIMMKPTIDR